MDNHSAFHSTEYDSKIKRTLPYYEEFYKQVIDIVLVYHPQTVTWLDVGCGTGKMAQEAFKQVKLEKFVFSDSSAEMIKMVKERYPFPNCSFLIQKVQELEFHNIFDVITAIQVNHYLQKEERAAVIQKCFDALKTDGMFITFENFAPFSSLGEQIYLERWKSYQLRQGKSEHTSEEHINRYNKEYFPISLSEHIDIMKSSGFRAVEILWLSYMQVGLLGIK